MVSKRLEFTRAKSNVDLSGSGRKAAIGIDLHT